MKGEPCIPAAAAPRGHNAGAMLQDKAIVHWKVGMNDRGEVGAAEGGAIRGLGRVFGGALDGWARTVPEC